MIKKLDNKDSGITLIALIITIIVLLILAGITIAQLSGNGLFENAKLAKDEYNYKQNIEKDLLTDYENVIDIETGLSRGMISLTDEEQEDLRTLLHPKSLLLDFKITFNTIFANQIYVKGSEVVIDLGANAQLDVGNIYVADIPQGYYPVGGYI